MGLGAEAISGLRGDTSADARRGCRLLSGERAGWAAQLGGSLTWSTAHGLDSSAGRATHGLNNSRVWPLTGWTTHLGGQLTQLSRRDESGLSGESQFADSARFDVLHGRTVRRHRYWFLFGVDVARRSEPVGSGVPRDFPMIVVQ